MNTTTVPADRRAQKDRTLGRRLAVFVIAFAVAYSLVSFVFGAEAPSSVPEHSLARVKLEPGEVCFILGLRTENGVAKFAHVDADKTETGYSFTGPPGQYAINVVKKDGGTQTLLVDIVAAGPKPPVPPGPTPPTPPGPDPPTPDPPGPTPPPVPDAGLRVLIIYESQFLSRLPREQLNILQGGEVHEFLSQNCVKVDGLPEWRMTDQHAPIVKSSPAWEAMFKRPRTEVPWVVISNGKAGHEGPLPANATEFIDLVRRFKL